MAGFGLAAGAISRGLEQALAGTNRGLLQGEEVRHQSAEEAMRQRYLEIAQQQLSNTLAQQAFQNTMAQQRLGLSRQQLEALNANREYQRRTDEANLALRQSAEDRETRLEPHKIRNLEATARFNELRPDIANRNTDLREQQVRAQIDVATIRLQQMQRRTDLIERSLGLRMTPQMKVQLDALKAKQASLLRQLYAATQAPLTGAQGLPKIGSILADLDEVEQAFSTLGTQNNPSNAPSNGGKSLVDALKKFNLQPAQ